MVQMIAPPDAGMAIALTVASPVAIRVEDCLVVRQSLEAIACRYSPLLC